MAAASVHLVNHRQPPFGGSLLRILTGLAGAAGNAVLSTGLVGLAIGAAVAIPTMVARAAVAGLAGTALTAGLGADFKRAANS